MTAVAYPQVDHRAPCRHGDPERYFPTTGNDMSDLAGLCRGCPFTGPCLAYALHYDVDGVWGGTSAAQRKRIRASLGISPVTLGLRRARRALCGTTGGYQRHRRCGERPCSACTAANNAYNTAYNAARRSSA